MLNFWLKNILSFVRTRFFFNSFLGALLSWFAVHLIIINYATPYLQTNFEKSMQSLAEELVYELTPFVLQKDSISINVNLRRWQQKAIFDYMEIVNGEGRPLGVAGTDLIKKDLSKVIVVESDQNLLGTFHYVPNDTQLQQQLKNLFVIEIFLVLFLFSISIVMTLIHLRQQGSTYTQLLGQLHALFPDLPPPQSQDQGERLKQAIQYMAQTRSGEIALLQSLKNQIPSHRVEELQSDLLIQNEDNEYHAGTLLKIRLFEIEKIASEQDADVIGSLIVELNQVIAKVLPIYGGVSTAEPWSFVFYQNEVGAATLDALYCAWIIQNLFEKKTGYSLKMVVGAGALYRGTHIFTSLPEEVVLNLETQYLDLPLLRDEGADIYIDERIFNEAEYGADFSAEPYREYNIAPNFASFWRFLQFNKKRQALLNKQVMQLENEGDFE